MKKIAMVLIFMLTFFCFGNNAFADWLITASWNRSTGPDLDHEKMLINGVEQCQVLPSESTACSFNRSAGFNPGEEVTVIAYNSSGQPSTPLVIGTLAEPTAPASPTGGAIFYQWQ